MSDPMREVLEALEDNPGGLTVNAIAEHTERTPQSVGPTLSALREREWVEAVDSENGQHCWRITAAGHTALPETP